MNKDKVLGDIFEDDPLGLLQVKAQGANSRSPDERLLASFLEINEYVHQHKKEPTANLLNVSEYQLYTRLKSLRADPEKIELLQGSDIYDLLPGPSQANDSDGEYENPGKRKKTIEDIFQEDTLNILSDDESGLFDFRHTPTGDDRAIPDFVARRNPCKDFEKYETSFRSVQIDLASGKRKLIPFKQEYLREGEFYVHNGILLYLERVDFEEEEQDYRSGKRIRIDGRTRTIFENGTESSMLYRSLYKAILTNGKSVTHNIDQVNENFAQEFSDIREEDQEAGYIYILKSKSEDPQISTIKDLFKIGYAKNVEERIDGAERQPTYLMAQVEYVAGWKCYNMNPQKLEQLIHNFFGSSCLEVDVFDEKGRRHTPREWFIAPLAVIEQAIELIINGKIVKYTYDPERKTIIEK